MGELDSYLSGCKHKRGRSAAYEFHMPSVVFVLHDFVVCSAALAISTASSVAESARFYDGNRARTSVVGQSDTRLIFRRRTKVMLPGFLVSLAVGLRERPKRKLCGIFGRYSGILSNRSSPKQRH